MENIEEHGETQHRNCHHWALDDHVTEYSHIWQELQQPAIMQHLSHKT